MNVALIENWNEVVSDNDVVYYLGDFCRGDPDPWMRQLNGKIIFIKGNHDGWMSAKIKPIRKNILFVYNGENFLMQHYPPVVLDGVWVIHGHVHNNDIENYPLINLKRKTVNVSAEILGYRPMEFTKVLRLRQALEESAHGLFP
jgi:calcineurin-like phosphoesterase family protein